MRFAILALVLALSTPSLALPPPGMPQESIERVYALPGSAIAWEVRFNKTNLRLTDDDGAATVAFAYWLMTSEAGESLYLSPALLDGWLGRRVERWSVAGPWLKAGLDRLVTAYAGQPQAGELGAIRAALFGREIVGDPTYADLNRLARWCDANNRRHQYWVEVLDAQPQWPYPRHIRVKLQDNDSAKNPIGTALSGRTYELRENMIYARYRTVFAPRWVDALAAGPLPSATRALDAAHDGSVRGRAMRDALRPARFAALHSVHVPPPATRGTISAATTLEALGGVAQGLTVAGHGDVDYWFRAATDLARTGRALGRAVVAVGRAMGDDAIARLVVQQGTQLTALQATGTGDVDYWLATAKSAGDQLAGAGAMLAQLGAASAASSQGLRLRVALDALVAVARSVDAAGTGTLDFWLRATEHNATVAQSVARQLKVVAAAAPPGTAPLLLAIAGLFSGVTASGHGTVDYWLARAAAAARQVRAHADTLEKTAHELDPAP